MSEHHAGPTLQTVLAGHLPLKSNRAALEAVARDGRAAVALALAPGRAVDEDLLGTLLDVLLEQGHRRADLLLHGALGPPSAAAWRVVVLLREHFEHLRAVVPFAADPAATLVGLAADELELSAAACLTLEAAQAEDRPPPPWTHALAARCLALRPASGQRPLDPAAVLGAFEPTAGGPALPVTRRDCVDRGLAVERPGPQRWANLRALHGYYREMLNLEGDLVVDGHHFLVRYEGFIDTLEARRALIRVSRADEMGRPLRDRPSLTRWVRPHGRDLVLDEEQSL